MENRTYIVLLGVPGAGKGTQARLLSEKLKLPQISTGEIFRYNLKNETELGLLAKGFMDQGNLVPDEVTVKMVEDRLQQDDAASGAIMDGFPRNLVQAEAFGELTAQYGGVATVPLITIPDDDALERITGRRECPICGAVYHIKFNPPKEAGVCDNDGGVLYQRDDDKPETARNRLFVYYKQTAPLIGYYFAHSVLAEVDGTKAIDDVHRDLLSTLPAVSTT